MNEEEKKRAAKELIERLQDKCKDTELYKAVIRDFESEPPEHRLAVAMGFVAIGTDRSENILYRNVMLSQLAMLIRSCSLQNDNHLQRQLNEVIDEWITTVPGQDFNAAPWGALWALGCVNRSAGLEKCDEVVKFYGESEAGRKVREVRSGVEQLL